MTTAILWTLVTMAPTPFPTVYLENSPIVLTAPTEGDFYSWSIDGLTDAAGVTPRKPGKRTFDNGRTCCVWARVGSYVATITAHKIDWDKRTVESTEDQVAFDVKPDGPTPPNPPNPPNPDKDVAMVQGWLKAIAPAAYSKDKVLAIAANYEATAAEAAATPADWNRDKLVAAVKQRNVATLGADGVLAWRDAFFQPLAVWQSSKGLSPSDLAGHVQLWQRTAVLMRAAAF